MEDAKNRIGVTELSDLEEKVAEILELREEAQPGAFQKLRDSHPERAAMLHRLERTARSIDPASRSVDAVAGAMRRSLLAEAPKEFGEYKVLDVLGEGGMGTVFLAEQQKPVRRRVALKVIKAGLDSQDVLARFEAERQALAMMAHANIAKVLDAGTTPEGRPYFALEHVPGLPIIEYCDRQRLGLSERIALFQKICHGVQHAHQKGVIHRDLKPTNILVQIRDGFAEPKIIDFGVAKALQHRLTERTLYTEQGRIVGTPEYMSPEQAEMSGLDIDTRSDIYSLGVMLYELLVGQLPFDSRELRRAGYFEMQRKIREDDPDRPSTRCSTAGAELRDLARRRRTDPRALARALHGDLDWIVMRCLEKDPARRYQSASELAADLQRHLDHDPVEAGPPSIAYRLGKFLRKRRAAVVAAATILLALIGGLSAALWQYGQARASAEKARVNEQRALRAESEAKTQATLALEAEREAKSSLELAERELTRSQSLNLAAASDRALLGGDAVAGLLLALEAVERDRSPETLSQVQTALSEQYLVAEFRGHEATVTSADFGPIRRRVVTTDRDGTVRLWSEDGDELMVLPEAGNSAVFSSDEQRIVTSGRMGRAVTKEGLKSVVFRVFRPDGEVMATIGGEGDRSLWAGSKHPEVPGLLVRYADGARERAVLDHSGVERRRLEELGEPLPGPGALFLSPEEHAVQWKSLRVTIWPPDGAEPIVLRTGRGSEFTRRRRHDRIAFDPRGELIATIHEDDVARLWNIAGDQVCELTGHTYTLAGVQFSPSGATILTASGDGTARLWDRDGTQRTVLSPGGEVGRALFYGSDHRIVTESLWRTLTLWNDKGRRLATLNDTQDPNNAGGRIADTVPEEGLVLRRVGHRAQLWRLGGVEGLHLRCDGDRPWYPACHPDGQVLAGSEDGRVFAWDRYGNLLRVFDSEVRKPTLGIAVSPDGSRVVAGQGEGMVHAWDWHTGERLWSHDFSQAAPMTDVAFLSSGLIWVHAAPTRTAYLLDPEQRTHELLFDRDTKVDDPAPGQSGGEFWAPRISADRGMVGLCAFRSGHVRLCDAHGKKLVDFVPQQETTSQIAFHPDGERLGTLSIDGTVQLWNLAEVLADPHGVEPTHSFSVPNASWNSGGPSFDFSPDGTRMLIATLGTAYVTNLENEVQFTIWPSEGRSGYIEPACFFSPDGKWIIGEAFDGARRWPAREEDLLRMARKWADRLGRHRDLREEYANLLGRTTDGR